MLGLERERCGRQQSLRLCGEVRIDPEPPGASPLRAQQHGLRVSG
jgi:hypothetical protein